MKIFPIFVAAVLLVTSAPSRALETQFLQGLGNSHYLQLESETIGRDFHVYIMLPEDYEQHPDQDYPTLFVLDGGGLFPLLVAYYRYLNFGGEIPNTIIIGISYGSDSFEGGNYRSTDYTAKSEDREYWGGANAFQEFLKEELIPYVERTYRARPDKRIIFGQSIGGQFVLYTALTEPRLFWGHIASNPALHRNLTFFLENHAATPSPGEPSRLFVASGSHDDARFRIPALKWIEHWTQNENTPWKLETKILDGHSHMSAPPASFRQGMRWLFSEPADKSSRPSTP